MSAENECPECRTAGKTIYTDTVRNMVESLSNLEITDDKQYHVCKTQDCPVVYFREDGNQSFMEDDIRVPVNFKQPADASPRQLCYCFGFTKQDVLEELRANDESTIPGWITERVQNEECACRWKNPKGGCCLSDVQPAVEDAKAMRNVE
jgi:hypothetical protein